MITNTPELLPWHYDLWRDIRQLFVKERLPHAMLFTGIKGLGKLQFACALAKAMLCSEPDAEARGCGQCRSCHFIAVGTHPDLKFLQPEETGQMIKVDQVREVIDFVNQTPLLGGYRVIIIHPASQLNLNAANALLKTLEEPTPKTLLVLVCENSAHLPATIISRCQRMIFTKPPLEVAKVWLQKHLETPLQNDIELLCTLAEGAPLQALHLAGSVVFQQREDLYRDLYELSTHKSQPIKVAAKWKEQDILTVLDLLFSWVKDLLHLSLTGDPNLLVNRDHQKNLQQLSAQSQTAALMDFADVLQRIRQATLVQINLNRELLLEEILIAWLEVAAKKNPEV